MIWLLAIPAGLLLLLCIPVVLTVRGTQNLQIRVWVLGIPFTVVRSDRPEKPSPAPKKREKSPETPEKKEKNAFFRDLGQRWKRDGAVATLEYLAALLRLLTDTVRRLLHIITVDRLCLRLDIAGEDAADTAVTVGKTCAVLYPSVALASSLFGRIRRKELAVSPDFLATQTRTDLRLTFHVIPLRLIGLLAGLIGRFFRIQTNHLSTKGQR